MNTIKTTFSKLGKREVSDYCRQLIKDGVDPKTRLEVYRDRETPDLSVREIGLGAKVKIKDDGHGDVRHVKYVPFPDSRMAFKA